MILVDTALDSASRGETTLRDAIERSNANPGPDEIRFAIPGAGPHAIQVTGTPLPTITDDALTIDGYSQPGARRNAIAVGDDAVILIQIDGGQLPRAANSSGLTINSSNNNISGLSITNFSGDIANRFGIVIAGNNKTVSGNHIHGNFLGLAPDGSTEQGNTSGVGIRSNYAGMAGSPGTTSGNFIGVRSGSALSTAAQRNLIAGSNDRAGISAGVLISGSANSTGEGSSAAADNVIAGNYFSTDRSGKTGGPALANIYGVRIQLGAARNAIDGNVIGGDPNVTDAAILIENDGSSDTRIVSNLIGVQADGVPGGLSPSTGIGINGLRSATSSIRNTLIQSNRIHQSAFDGIFLFGANVGGTDILDNEIVGSGDDGVSIFGGSLGNLISGNAIFGSGANGTGGLGIDLDDDGPTANDGLDPDNGANGLQNFPVLMFAFGDAEALSVEISGTLNSTPNASHTIEFFSNDPNDGEGGPAEGQRFLGSITAATNALGNASFQFNATSDVSLLGSRITAVAINDATGDSSEFSDAILVTDDGGGELNGSIAGFVYQDLNDDGIKQTSEPGIAGVRLTLLSSSEAIFSAITSADGAYRFADLPADRYTIAESQPPGFLDGKETVGSQGGNLSMNDQIRDIVLPPGVNAFGYLFGERPDEGGVPSFVVTNVNDNGPGSLRQVLSDANSFPGRDRITFNIPGAGPFMIRPNAALPAITDSVIIDATSQPGFSGLPIIVLNGASAGANADGLRIIADRTEVRGFVIQRFAGCGIALVDADFSSVQGNWIGLSADGRSAAGNLLDGICVFNSAGNTIGGSSVSQRNVISGNGSASSAVSASGIHVRGIGSRGNLIQGNFIGTNANGDAPLGNSAHGVFIGDLADSNRVADNLISANGGAVPGAGVFISARNNDETPIAFSSYAGNRVEANLIGTNAAGDAPLRGGQRVGVVIDDLPNNLVVNNTISGNDFMGVLIARSRASNNRVIGNRIGTDLTGRFALPNGGVFQGLGRVGDGVGINQAPNNTIGGIGAGEANLIAGNLRFGTNVFGAGSTGNAVGANFNRYGVAADGTRLPNGSGAANDIFLNNGGNALANAGGNGHTGRGVAHPQPAKTSAQPQKRKGPQIAKFALRLKNSLKLSRLIQSGAKPR